MRWVTTDEDSKMDRVQPVLVIAGRAILGLLLGIALGALGTGVA
jgi:hypothetical protein